MKIYCVYDDQFELFSEPFLCADDAAAERLVVQTAIFSDGYRKRVSFYTLYAIGSFEPAISWDKMPMRSFKRPELVSGGNRIAYLVEQCELAQKSHLATVSASESDVREDLENE